MEMSVLRCTLLAAALVVASAPVALAQATTTDSPTAPPPIEVRVECQSSPERVRITNNTGQPVRVKRVGSIEARRAGEPFAVTKTLKPGRSVSYTFGTGEGKGKRLSGSFVFDNVAASEGVVVRTSRGRVRVRCDDMTNAPPEPRPAAAEAVPDQPADIAPDGAVGVMELLETLRVELEEQEGYARDRFVHWVDADADGCDTRREVLIAESITPVTFGPGCSIEGGTWFSAADGDTLTNPASMDINHVVPLKEAWASGAHAWTAEQRQDYANDLLDERSLQAVSAGANRQQGESDPASWLPANLAAACEFVSDWVAIKASWRLSVDPIEREAIRLTLENCPERMVSVVPRATGASVEGD